MGTLMLSENINNLVFTRKRVVEELLQGKEFADRLRVLLRRPFGEGGGGDHGGVEAELAAEDLVGKILRSFNESLSVLSGGGGGGGGETMSSAAAEVQEVCCDDSMVSGGRRSEDSGESKKRLVGPKGRRGCYKRKKNSETWRIVTHTIEDGYAWRKYGQKDILNTTYPRSYFRCTHKYDQGCKATKQVQKMEDNPQMYETIYVGNHTCTSQVTITGPQMIITDNVINNVSDHHHGQPNWTSNTTTSASVLSSSTTPSTVVVVKQEYINNFKEETQSTTTTTGGDDFSENLSSLSHHHHDHHYDHQHHEQMEYNSVWEDLLPLDGDELCFDESDFFLASSC